MTTRESKIVLTVEDKFSAPLKNFSGAMDNAGKSTEKMTQQVGKTAQIGDRLQASFGGSSRAVNQFGNAVAGALGATGPLGYSIDLLIDQGPKAALAFGAMTAGVTALGFVVDQTVQGWNKYQDSLKNAGKLATEAAKGVKTYEQALREAMATRAAAFGKSEEEYFSGARGAMARKELEETVKRQYESERLIVRAQVDSISYANIQRKIEEDRAELLKQEVKAIQDATAARIAYINASTTTLRQIGLGVTGEELQGLYETGTHNVPGENDSRFDSFMKAQEAQRRKQDEASRAAASYASQQANLIKRVQSQALQLYNRMSSDAQVTSQEISQSFADAFTSIVEAQAELNNNSSISMIQLQQIFGQAFSGMSQDMVGKLLGVMDAGGEMAASLIRQLYAIAAAGGSAAEQIEAIKAVLAGLPSDKYINIHLRYTRSGAGAGGGNQQGDEWWFTLEGEDFATRDAYMRQYGDYGRANEAWQRDHREELKHPKDPNKAPQTGPNSEQPGFGNAYGFHDTVTGPRMMLVGEAGPERVDITPGTSPRGGMGGATVNVSFSSLVPPTQYDIEQLAAKLKRYMRL